MDFVFIANQWDVYKDNPTSKHQIALELVRVGHRVLWVVGSGMRTPNVGSRSDRGRILRKIRDAFACVQERNVKFAPGAGRLYTVAPLILPFPSSSFVRKINEAIYLGSITLACGKLQFNNPILINFIPNIPGVHKKWKNKSVYYCVDRWSAFENYDSRLMDMLDAECCKAADVVIASARGLEQNCIRHNNNTHLLLHGVDYDNFSKAVLNKIRPSDLPGGKIIGFFGLLSSWIDQDLLINLARSFPNVAVVLIGMADVDTARLKKESNIYLLGKRDYSSLSDYISFFDVGLIPFVINDLTNAVNPIKLREMLAAGCRVVSTKLPEVVSCRRDLERFNANGIMIAENHNEFIEATKKLLENPLSQNERLRLSKTMESETWQAKVNNIIELVK